MRIYNVQFKQAAAETDHVNVIWGRSKRWQGKIRRVLRSEGWVIVKSEAVETGKTKGELLNWLNANFKVALIAD